MNGHMRPATLEDAVSLAPRLRQADLQELVASAGPCDPVVPLALGVATSVPCYALIARDGELSALLGVTPTVDRMCGAIWLLGTDAIERNARDFLRHTRSVADKLNDLYPVLFNYVDERNTVHRRWIEWAGFTFINRIEHHGAEKRPFLEFIRVRKAHV